MGVDVPSDYTIDLDVGGQLDLDTTIDADIRLPTAYGIGIDRIPKIELGVDPVELKPVDLSLRLKELPSIRAHLPADFKIGLALFGTELLTVRLCGEAQMITEDYKRNPCEVCGDNKQASGATINLIALDGGGGRG